MPFASRPDRRAAPARSATARPWPRGRRPRSRRARWWRATARRLLAAACAAAAVLATWWGLHPPAPRALPVVVAATDLPAGTRLAAADVVETAVPTAYRPPGALDETGAALDRVLVSPIRAGEPVTVSRLLDGSLASLPPGTVAVHVLTADPGALELAPAGTRVSLYPAGGGTALVSGVWVVGRDAPDRGGRDGLLDTGGGDTLPGLVVAVPRSGVDRIFAGQRDSGGPPVVLVAPSG